MVITPTGLIVIILGLWSLGGGYARILIVIVALTVFEAAAAANLPVLGGASITPARLFLIFIFLKLVLSTGGISAIFAEISVQRVLFIYVLLLIWAVPSAFFLPRIFHGVTLVYSLQRTEADSGLVLVPLVPSSGNVTQAVYAIGSFLLALCVTALVRRNESFKAVLTGLLLVSGLNIAFALLDLVTAETHTGFLLDFIHTANYSLLTDDEAAGMKRISGSFTETSSFSAFSLILLAVNLSLFMQRVRPRLTGLYTLALLILLLLSTSTTAYIGVAVFAIAFVVFVLYALIRNGDADPLKKAAYAAGAIVFGIAVLELTAPSFPASAWALIDSSVFQKTTSSSAIERGMLNTQALKIFFDTYGIGAGLGATRTSNYVFLLASNVGIFGLLLFGSLITVLLFMPLRPELSDLDRKIVTAARVGLLGVFVPALLTSTIFDLGPLTYILVGTIAAGAGVPAMVPARRPDRSTNPQTAKMTGRPSTIW